MSADQISSKPTHPKHRFTEESRKQSASDLQSRLKTRKLLGVGELAGDNGDIYKSKISQLLGINESLYVRMPRGLLYWNSINTLYFLIFGLGYIFYPKFGILMEYGITNSISDETHLFVRLYGSILFSFGIIFKCVLQLRESRAEHSSLLLISGLLHLFQLTALFFTYNHMNWWICLTKGTLLIGNIIYHAIIDSQGGFHKQFIRIIQDIPLIFLSTPIVDRKIAADVLKADEDLNEKDKTL